MIKKKKKKKDILLNLLELLDIKKVNRSLPSFNTE